MGKNGEGPETRSREREAWRKNTIESEIERQSDRTSERERERERGGSPSLHHGYWLTQRYSVLVKLQVKLKETFILEPDFVVP